MFAERADRDWMTRDAGRRARDAAHRRRHRARSCPRRSRSVDRPRAARRPTSSSPPLPEPALHARHERVDLRRRLDQPRCSGPRASTRRSTSRRSTASTRASATPSFQIWFGGVDHDWGGASIEGGDIMPVGDGVVLVGQGERSDGARRQHPRAEPVRRRRGAARDRRADAARARGDAPRHGLHVLRPRRRDDLRAGRRARSSRSSTRPTATAASAPRSRSGRSSTRSRTRSDSSELKVVTTGGDEFEAERNQWDDGNNVVALSPGVVVAYERNEATNAKLAKAGIEVHAIAGPGARPRPRRRPLHDLPDRPRRLKGARE